MLKQIPITLFLFFLFSVGLAQSNFDENQLNYNVYDLSLDNLIDSANKYSYIDLDKSIFFGKAAFNESANKNTRELGDLYLVIGFQYIEKNDNASCLELANEILEKGKRIKDTILIGHGYFLKYMVNYRSEKWGMAKFYLTEAINAYSIDPVWNLAEAYTSLAIIMVITDYPDKSMQYFKMAVQFSEQFDPPPRVKISVYVNYAYSMTLTKSTFKSNIAEIKKYNSLAKQVAKNSKNVSTSNIVTININNFLVALEEDNVKVALNNVNAGFKLVDNKNIFAYCFYLQNVLKFYMHPKVKDYKNAKKYAEILLELSLKNELKEYSHEAYKILALVANEQDEYLKVADYMIKSDSLYRIYVDFKSSESITELEESVQNIQDEYEEELMQKDLEAQKKANNTLWIFITLLTLFSLMLFYSYWKNTNQNKILKTINKELEISKLKLQESNIKFEQFGKKVSHDLRNPVRAMLSIAEIIKKQNSENELIDYIISSGKDLQEIIFELLETAKIDNNLEVYDVNLNNVLGIVKQNLSKEISESKVNIKSDVLPNLKAYNSEMVQLFYNLIDNSIKYRKKDTPLVVEITFKEDNKWLTLFFTDNGIGIEASEKKAIFNFMTSSNIKKDSYGIGLSTCLSIVKDYNGTIDIESKVGKGSTFIIKLSKTRGDKTLN